MASSNAAIAKAKVASMEQADAQIQLVLATGAEMKARLKREQERTRMAENTVRNAWRDILRLAKTEELRAEIAIVSQSHERDVELREAAVRSALAEIESLEQQQVQAVRSHMRQLDRLFEIQSRRVSETEAEFEADLARLEREWETEKASMVAKHRALRLEVLHILRAAREEEDSRLSSMEADFQQARETVRRRALERIHTLQTEMDVVIEGLERAFEEAHARYIAATDHRTQDFKTLTAKGQRDGELKEQQRRLMKRLQQQLHYWQGKLAHSLREADEKAAVLTTQRDTLAGHLAKLKGELSSAQGQSQARLKALAIATQSAQHSLDERLALARRILGLAEAVRALEGQETRMRVGSTATMNQAMDGGMSYDGNGTGDGGMYDDAGGVNGDGQQQEQQQMWNTGGEQQQQQQQQGGAGGAASASAVAASIVRDVLTSTAIEHGITVNGDADGAAVQDALANAVAVVAPAATRCLAEGVETAEELDGFYGRMNSVLLEKVALERRRDRVQAENQELRAALRQVLSGLTLGGLGGGGAGSGTLLGPLTQRLAGTSGSGAAGSSGHGGSAKNVVADNLLKGPNPLLVVNGRTGLDPAAAATMAVIKGPRVLAQQEAVMIASNYAKLAGAGGGGRQRAR